MATISLDTGTTTATAQQLQGASGRVEAALAPPALAGTVDVLGHAVQGAWSGPYAASLAAGTRVETSGGLAVTTGGSAGRLSGGATAGDLVLGVEYGGGRRVGSVRAGRRSAAHARRTTAQFRGQTLAAEHAIDDAADTAAAALADDVEQAVTS